MIKVQGRNGLTADTLASALRSQRDAASDGLNKLAAELAKNPAYAMGWSMKNFREAAECELTEHLIKTLEHGQPVEIIGEMLLQIVILSAASGESSSLETSNMMDRARLQAAAAILKRYFYN